MIKEAPKKKKKKSNFKHLKKLTSCSDCGAVYLSCFNKPRCKQCDQKYHKKRIAKMLKIRRENNEMLEKERKCLMCEKKFTSFCNNRICDKCKESDSYQDGQDMTCL